MTIDYEAISTLTSREIEVIEAVIEGLTDREISKVLTISHRTVHNHLRNIFDKLGVRSRTKVAVLYLAHELASAD